MNFTGVPLPFSGDDHSKNINSARWLRALVRAATSRDQNPLPPPNPLPVEAGLDLKWTPAVDLPAWSVIGVIGDRTFAQGAMLFESDPTLEASIDKRCQLTVYTKYAHLAANVSVTGFILRENDPVRLLFDYDPAVTYIPGMPVGRLPGSTKISVGGGGMVLVTPPFSVDAGATFYAWVILDKTNRWQVRYKEDVPPAIVAEETPGSGLAYLDMFDPASIHNLETTTLEVRITNRNEGASFAVGSFGEVTWDKDEWVPLAAGGGGTHDIEFTVVSMDCYSDPWILTVEVTWFSGGCDTPIPGADEYTGHVEVQNRCNIAKHFTDTNIVGLAGTATYRYPRTGTCEPAWRLDDICGEGECPI